MGKEGETEGGEGGRDVSSANGVNSNVCHQGFSNKSK